MNKCVFLFLSLCLLSQLVDAGRWKYKKRRRNRQVCDEWCFSSTSCMVPGNNTCTTCLVDACGHKFENPFESSFGRECIDEAVFGNSRSPVCEDACPNWTSERSETCENCLKPCIKAAKKNSDNHCPNSAWWENNNHCSACVSNTTCPTKEELFVNASAFCCSYVELSCGEYPDELLDDDLNPWNVSCFRDAYGSDCSKCPSFDNNRWADCSDCLDTCKDRVMCALECGANNYPLGEIGCPYCKSLCEANSNAGDDCVATNCPQCAECNDCHSTCEGEGYFDNVCECIEKPRYYNYRPWWHYWYNW